MFMAPQTFLVGRCRAAAAPCNGRRRAHGALKAGWLPQRGQGCWHALPPSSSDDLAAPSPAAEAAAAPRVLGLPLESETKILTSSNTVGAAPGVLAPGTTVHERYVVQDVLGRGANATTYRAVDSTSGKEVALKALSLKGLRDWKQLELFQREAMVLRGLAHPSIPAYLDYFEEDSDNDRAFYIVQEVVVGRSLAQMLAAGERCDEAEALRIAGELLAVLKYLGGLLPPVVHRDIKPGNVVLAGGAWGGRVFLVDFGGVQGVSSGQGDVLGSTIVGTYGFMAPEQFTGQAVPASDLYALGSTLLFMVSGLAPGQFTQTRMKLDWRDRVTVGPQLAELLDGLLEPLAEERLTPQQAIDIVTGRTERRRRKLQASTAAAAAAGDDRRRAMAPSIAGSASARLASMPTSAVRKPAGSRVQLSASPGRLDVDIPSQGLSGDNIGTGLFALAWNAFVAFWTFSAVASGGILFALFSAPFWFAGYQLAGQALSGALTRERFAIGRNKWRVAQELAALNGGVARFGGGAVREAEGRVDDLTGARLVTTVVVNGVPRTAIELVEGVRKHRFGEALEPAEQEWLVWEINQHITGLRGAAPRADDMPPEDVPEVVDDDMMSDVDPFWRDGSRGADPFNDRDDMRRKR